MAAPLILHYAPDNASLCVRLALEVRGVPYQSRLVDRRALGQKTAAYLRLNPNGLIPALETPEGPLFETAAILLWLDEWHGPLLPNRDSGQRGAALSWLFWLSNSLHPALRMLFNPSLHIDATATEMLNRATQSRIRSMLDLIDAKAATHPDWLGGESPGALDCYLCPMLRWLALYPVGATDWFRLADWPTLRAVSARLELHPATAAAILAEGLGPTPFTTPRLPQPPEGSAT